MRCPNPSCQNFDGSPGGSGSLRVSGSRASRRSDFSPSTPVSIRCRNFRGEEQTFTAEQESLRRKHNDIIARVVPTGEEISLLRERIQNLDEGDDAVPQGVASEPQGADRARAPSACLPREIQNDLSPLGEHPSAIPGLVEASLRSFPYRGLGSSKRERPAWIV